MTTFVKIGFVPLGQDATIVNYHWK